MNKGNVEPSKVTLRNSKQPLPLDDEFASSAFAISNLPTVSSNKTLFSDVRRHSTTATRNILVCHMSCLLF
jgi:hypothetical protein